MKFAANPDLLPQFQAFLEAQGAAKSSVPESGPPQAHQSPMRKRHKANQPHVISAQHLVKSHLPGALSTFMPGLAVVIVVAPAPTPAPVLALALGPVLALALVSSLLLTIAPRLLPLQEGPYHHSSNQPTTETKKPRGWGKADYYNQMPTSYQKGGCYKACPWLFHFRGKANDDCWVARLVIQQYLVQAKGYDPKRRTGQQSCRNASKLAHKDVIPPKDEDPYYINVPEGGYGNGPKRLAKFKRSDSPSCGRSLSTQLPPSTSSSNRHARRADKVVSEEEARATASKSSASTTKPAHSREISKRQVLESPLQTQIPAPGKPPVPRLPRDRLSPSPPQDSPRPRLRPTPGKVPNKDASLNVEVVLRSPAPVKPMEPCRKEPSKPAADPKETRRLKRKAENNAAAKPRRGAGRGQGGREQGPSKQKIRPRMRPKRDPTPEPEPKSQLPPPTPASESAQQQPQPQPEGGKEHPDGGDGASSTKPSAPKPRESTPAPDSPPTPKQTKRGRSRNIPDVGASIYLVN
ncbi:hypothetical protein RHS01_10450 [Rhizoctonia solani]|uniref:Uncharacterized protein n=1 Tax=Rhizoctonia solani TaxID=456999 RepID=A0A8H7I4U3_9AGAM|nr:hypothetical protein RHS01_10450 [Rhizoctonia solani]